MHLFALFFLFLLLPSLPRVYQKKQPLYPHKGRGKVCLYRALPLPTCGTILGMLLLFFLLLSCSKDCRFTYFLEC
uniref:Putative ovule protein n=1 Tax=Solanum chacoense TaxID=4108 RepID=A0A0V0HV64_SOLCH